LHSTEENKYQETYNLKLQKNDFQAEKLAWNKKPKELKLGCINWHEKYSSQNLEVLHLSILSMRRHNIA
jgi:hypothetical protein